MRELLAKLPAVTTLADAAASHPAAARVPRWAVIEAARRAIGARREAILGSPATTTNVEIDASEVAAAALALVKPALRRVINATGVVLHTNLGRAPLGTEARAAIDEIAGNYSNLEYDLVAGERGSRHDHLRTMLCDLTGAEDAIVVNNNAAAMILCLASHATQKEIIVSRGELIELGGSFRLPEILALSGGILVEVGTTNKTHLYDYERAIRAPTGMLLKVHRSNFTMVGFTSEVSVSELAQLGRARGLPTLVDLGSGALVDRDKQRQWHLPEEPTVAETVATGADMVTFSGDKLVGGPQAGIVVGARAAIEKARAHPLMRALRPDKLTLAGLAATLACYRDGRLAEVPAMRMLSTPSDALEAIAQALRGSVGTHPGLEVVVEPCISTVGGGAMPSAQLPSFAVTVKSETLTAVAVEKRLRAAGVIARIDANRVWLDVRTVFPAELGALADAIRALV